MNIGIIGAGHLGKALIAGLIKSGMEPEQIILNARSAETLSAVKGVYPGIRTAPDKKDLAAQADIIVVIVKAQNAADVFSEIREADLSGKTIISFMAGVTFSDIRDALQDPRGKYSLIRIMPTVGISLCKGVIGVCCEKDSPETQSAVDLFRPLGYIIPLPEEKLEGITICAASGLAFAAYLMKTYRDSCGRLLDDAAVSEEITTRVFENVIETVRSGENSFDSLIEQISTKGGTTEAGMNVLLSSNLDEILNQCLDSAYARVSGLKGN